MNYILAALRQQVVQRAVGRCEYCRLSQKRQEASFHIDHVMPVAHGGATHLDNLALACVSCSLRKAARREVVDPHSDQSVPIYNPRRQPWDTHFRWQSVRVVGQTETGRATVEALAMNRPLALAIRAEEVLLGRHPPAA